jgi:hypothetical protein
MHRISNDEYAAAHRIYSHAESLVHYYGPKTRHQVEGYVSENRWVMFPESHIESLRAGATLPIPNVFLSFADEIVDNGSGKVDGWMGLTYHNVEAMQGLMGGIMKRAQKRDRFINLLKNMGDDWMIEIQNKTMTDCPFTTPKYRTAPERRIKPSAVDAAFIQKAVADSDHHLLRRGDPYPDTGNPVIWDVSIFVALKPTTAATFDEDFKTVFGLFQNVLGLQ